MSFSAFASRGRAGGAEDLVARRMQKPSLIRYVIGVAVVWAVILGWFVVRAMLAMYIAMHLYSWK